MSRWLGLFAFGLLPLLANPGASTEDTQAIVERYLRASREQQDRLRGLSMDVDIDASIPKLRKRGKLSALRHISKIGRISYVVRSFVGDDTVKKDVIARYLSAETQAQQQNGPSLAITPDNYRFRYKGLKERDSVRLHVFEVSPKQKRVGLFRGELWLDPETCLPVRESGRLVKNPSIFVKRVDFVRNYEIRDGVAFLQRIDSVVDTRIVGRTELHIEYRNVSPEAPSAEPASDAESGQPR